MAAGREAASPQAVTGRRLIDDSRFLRGNIHPKISRALTLGRKAGLRPIFKSGETTAPE
jgi:hypothetical protein